MPSKGSQILLDHTLRIAELDKNELSNQARIRVPYTRIILPKTQVNMLRALTHVICLLCQWGKSIPFIVGPRGVFQFSSLLIVFNFLLSDLERWKYFYCMIRTQ